MYHLIALTLLLAFFYYTNFVYVIIKDTDYMQEKFTALALLKQKGKAQNILKGL